ncbi:MAG TPA: MarR family transcriptional regulator [Actinomycetota bacterium]|nr:MarR family transcriptional regulator [Actinomycetota bacterium]
MRDDLSDEDYTRLLRSRDGLRRFLRWSEREAERAGITPAQHQLLLVVRAHGAPPTIGEVAEHLLLRHHSAVELVDRAEAAGLVRRRPDRHDLRTVRLELTARGARTLASLSALHLEELTRLGGHLGRLWAGLGAPS